MPIPDFPDAPACQWLTLAARLGLDHDPETCPDLVAYRANVPTPFGTAGYLLCLDHGSVANMEASATLTTWSEAAPTAAGEPVDVPDRRPGDSGFDYERYGDLFPGDRHVIAYHTLAPTAFARYLERIAQPRPDPEMTSHLDHAMDRVREARDEALDRAATDAVARARRLRPGDSGAFADYADTWPCPEQELTLLPEVDVLPPIRGAACWFLAGTVVGTAVGITVVGDAFARYLERRRAR